jgi:hypothetical protein
MMQTLLRKIRQKIGDLRNRPQTRRAVISLALLITIVPRTSAAAQCPASLPTDCPSGSTPLVAASTTASTFARGYYVNVCIKPDRSLLMAVAPMGPGGDYPFVLQNAVASELNISASGVDGFGERVTATLANSKDRFILNYEKRGTDTAKVDCYRTFAAPGSPAAASSTASSHILATDTLVCVVNVKPNDVLWIRSKSSAKGKKVGRASHNNCEIGEDLIFTGRRSGSWVSVQHESGARGWVNSKFLLGWQSWHRS